MTPQEREACVQVWARLCGAPQTTHHVCRSRRMRALRAAKLEAVRNRLPWAKERERERVQAA
jgi:hypothetical protein